MRRTCETLRVFSPRWPGLRGLHGDSTDADDPPPDCLLVLTYHSLNSCQFPRRAIRSPHNLASVLLRHPGMRHPHNLEKTTIRLTAADRKILERLTELTGLKQSQLIRASLRVLLRNVERPVER